jgi:hypothetical protein
LTRTSMPGFSGVNSSKDSWYAAATSSSHSRTVTTVLPLGSAERAEQHGRHQQDAMVSASAAATNVDKRGWRLNWTGCPSRLQ